MEGAILNTMSFLEEIDFGTIFQLMGVGLILFWFVVIGWAVFDAVERFPSLPGRIFSIFIVIALFDRDLQKMKDTGLILSVDFSNLRHPG